jgi:hypothetical protein
LLVVAIFIAVPCSWIAVKSLLHAKWQLESVPTSIIVLRALEWSDGGTITIDAISDDGTPHSVVLIQRMFPAEDAGCLYFDKEIVPVRSELEKRVINVLKGARISYPPGPMHNPLISNAEQEDETRRNCAALIAQVESDTYTDFRLSHH